MLTVIKPGVKLFLNTFDEQGQESFGHIKLTEVRPKEKENPNDDQDFYLQFEGVPSYYLLSRVHPRQNELRREFFRQQAIKRLKNPFPVNSGISGSVFGSGL